LVGDIAFGKTIAREEYKEQRKEYFYIFHGVTFIITVQSNGIYVSLLLAFSDVSVNVGKTTQN
jgi:hypothetical protein